MRETPSFSPFENGDRVRLAQRLVIIGTIASAVGWFLYQTSGTPHPPDPKAEKTEWKKDEGKIDSKAK